MGSSRKHRDKDRERSRSRSKSKDKYEKSGDKSDRNHRSSHRHKDKESSSGSRKRQRPDNTSDDDLRSDKKQKVKEVKDVSKSSNSSVNKTLKLDQKSSEVNDRTNRRDTQHTKDESAPNDASKAESLSIEETNKLRLKLGLKPLDVSTGEDKPATDKMVTVEVFVKTEKMSDKIEAQKIREKIEVQRNKRKITQKLRHTKGLAESDGEEDATDWIMKTRKLAEEKARAQKRAQMLEEMDEEFGVSSLIEEDLRRKKATAYSSKHLKGLTVGHKEEEFQEGRQVVLTLKDKDVLDEDEDVLQNVNMIDDSKAKLNIENKAKRPDYKPYDEPELDEFGILKKKSLLSKYDEEIEGPKKESFKLGVTSGNRSNDIEMIRMKLKQEEGKISLFTTRPKIANEYFTEEEMTKFKKPKKVRKKGGMRVKKVIETNDDLVSNLTASADHGSRKRPNIETTEDNGNEPDLSLVKEEIPDDKPKIVAKSTLRLEDMEVNEDFFDPRDQDLSGVVLEEDEADKELQMALHKSRKLKIRTNIEATTGAASIAKVAQTVHRLNQNVDEDPNDSNDNLISNNIILNSTAEFCRNLGDIPTYGLAGNRDEDEELMELEEEVINEPRVHDSDPTRGQWNEVEVRDDDIAPDLDDNEGQPILEEEPDVSRGLVAREVNREDDKIGRRERYSGPVSDFREKNDYKPEIKLDYVDEKGRVLDQKEAFRHLSHKFHGKGPSKNKIDKRMKKKDQQSKLRQMSSTDTPLNTLRMLTDKQKELQLPYVVLTGGQKTAIQYVFRESDMYLSFLK
ncbi:unnamed protein product [Medioppia subpectinata]|uniref:U4/U6.U5 tri-snRNP-associated protein 1 n=1 Tax=Medioppia subpectinata TaxID=1979941 RepID=A0A7R9L6W0_9ACAR|nr:unnamed protein product [Medioppia subpectinata]CAG2115520.1 unnamed protein product [Medioppia subpectinata]